MQYFRRRSKNYSPRFSDARVYTSPQERLIEIEGRSDLWQIEVGNWEEMTPVEVQHYKAGDQRDPISYYLRVAPEVRKPSRVTQGQVYTIQAKQMNIIDDNGMAMLPELKDRFWQRLIFKPKEPKHNNLADATSYANKICTGLSILDTMIEMGAASDVPSHPNLIMFDDVQETSHPQEEMKMIKLENRLFMNDTDCKQFSVQTILDQITKAEKHLAYLRGISVTSPAIVQLIKETMEDITQLVIVLESKVDIPVKPKTRSRK